MKFKYLIALSLIFVFLTIGAISAADDFDNLTVQDTDDDLAVTQQDTILLKEDTSTSTVKTQKANPIKTNVKFSNDVSKRKQSKYFKIKITDKKTKKPLKNIKVKFKVKNSTGQCKICNLKTDKKGVAKFNMKILKPGVHKVYLSSDKYILNEDYGLKDQGKYPVWSICIWKAKKSTTLKMNTHKKIKGEWMYTFHQTKDGQFSKGVYVTGDMGNEKPGFVLLKAKFFFKNKKTGKIITKTSNCPDRGVKLIKGYTPIKTKVWYGTLK